ncbi:MAG: hypothetical protein ACLTSX_14645 [Collinsella sp.]
MMSKVAACRRRGGRVYCEASPRAHDELRLRRMQHLQCRDDRRHAGCLACADPVFDATKVVVW